MVGVAQAGAVERKGRVGDRNPSRAQSGSCVQSPARGEKNLKRRRMVHGQFHIDLDSRGQPRGYVAAEPEAGHGRVWLYRLHV
jgi:hypothetical protein